MKGLRLKSRRRDDAMAKEINRALPGIRRLIITYLGAFGGVLGALGEQTARDGEGRRGTARPCDSRMPFSEESPGEARCFWP